MKKGSIIAPEWLVKLMIAALEITATILIVAGIGYVIYQSQKSPQDQDFKRVLDASAKLINDYDAGRIFGRAEIPVPISSENPLDIAFYPDGGLEKQCKGKSCLCMYYVTGSGASKTTCKVMDLQQKCSGTCGDKLCAGPLYPPSPEGKGGIVNLKIECTTQGSQFIVT